MSTLTAFLTTVANAIREKKGTAESIPAENFASEITSISTGIERAVRNDDSIVPTGTYASSTYYNTTYGVKIGYMGNGDVILSMQAGTTTAYEKLYFQLDSNSSSGITILTASSDSSYIIGSPGLIYACVLSGIAQPSTITITMNNANSTYDYTEVKILVVND